MPALDETLFRCRKAGCQVEDNHSATVAANLILVRLLANTSLSAAKSVFNDLKPYLVDLQVAKKLSARDTFEVASKECEAKNWTQPNSFECTPLGREVAWQLLGCLHPPILATKLSWANLKRGFLIAAAFQFQPSDKTLRWLSKSEGLYAAILIRYHQLGLPSGSTSAAVLDAIAWQQLKSGNHQKNLPSERRFTRKNVLKYLCFDGVDCVNPLSRLACLATGSANANADRIRVKVINHWIENVLISRSEIVEKSSKAACDTGSFANYVQRIVDESADGDSKVLINTVWQRVRLGMQDLSRSTFDTLILSAAKQDLISIARADLPELLAPTDVRESEISPLVGSGTFHYIRVSPTC